MELEEHEDIEECEELKDLILTHNEALYLDDSLTMMLEREGDYGFTTMRPLIASASLPAPVNLIEKIAKAILFTGDDNNQGMPATVAVNDGDLYLLRELTQSYIKVGGEFVGYNLKRKVYELLYGDSYQKDKQVDAMLSSALPDRKDSISKLS